MGSAGRDSSGSPDATSSDTARNPGHILGGLHRLSGGLQPVERHGRDTADVHSKQDGCGGSQDNTMDAHWHFSSVTPAQRMTHRACRKAESRC